MTISKLLRLLSLLLAVTLVASACGSDSGDESSDGTTEEGTDDTSGDEGASGEDVELTQGGSTLDAVRERGTVVCGANEAGDALSWSLPRSFELGFRVEF